MLKGIRLLVLLFVTLGMFGCANLAEDVAKHLLESDVRAIDQELTVFEGDWAMFRSCLKTRGGSCQGATATPLPQASSGGATVTPTRPGASMALASSVAKMPAGHPARNAHNVLTHAVVQQVAGLHDHFRGHEDLSAPRVSMSRGDGKSTVNMNVSVRQVEDFQRQLASACADTGWEALDGHCSSMMQQSSAKDDADLVADCRKVAFIRRYFDAYFRAGRFVELDLDVSQAESQLDAKITAAVKKASSKLGPEVEQKAEQLATEINNELNKELDAAKTEVDGLLHISRVGFVSRDNTFTARVPTLMVTIDPAAGRLLTVTDEDTGQTLSRRSKFANLGVDTDTSGVGTGDLIGAEIVRVFLEALFDAHEGLPAVAPVNSPSATGLSVPTYPLPRFNPSQGNVSAADFTNMTMLNTQVATQTRIVVGRIISGIGPFNLDNEALEDLITELVTTSVRKAAAKASWCWYACDLDSVLVDLGKDTEKAVDDKAQSELDKARGWAEGEAHKVRTWAHKEAEKVELRLGIGN
ncbi:MAG: hypothetical protein AAGD38_13480 [Acidobacteriota bacterium]